MKKWIIAAAVALPFIAHAAQIEPGNWEFTVDLRAKGLGAFQPKPGPMTKTRCITPEEASNPAKVVSDAVARGECQLSNGQDTGSELSFDVKCTGRVPMQGSGKMRYSAENIDGNVNLDGDAQGMHFTSRSHVRAKRLGACTF